MDLKDKKLKILVEIFGNYSVSGNEFLFKCPYCDHHKKKLSINLEKGAKCWICDAKTPNISRLIRKHGTFLQLQAWRELTNTVEIADFDTLFAQPADAAAEEQTVQLPEEFISLCNRNTSLTSVQAKNYLYSRGVDSADILRWKLGYCPVGTYEGRIIAPSFNLDGKCNYFVGRTYTKHWKKYMNPPESRDIIFNELYIDWDEDVVLCEGVFDALKVPNSIPILGSTLREDSKLFAQIVKNDSAIYLALDPDAEKKIGHLVEALLRYGIEIYKVEISPYKDVGEMAKDEFLRRKGAATLIKNTDSLLLQKIMSI